MLTVKEARRMYYDYLLEHERKWVEDLKGHITVKVAREYIPNEKIKFYWSCAKSPKTEAMHRQVQEYCEAFGWIVEFHYTCGMEDVHVYAKGDTFPKWWEFWKHV